MNIIGFNHLVKMQNGGSWNAGASSLNQIHEGGFFEFTAIETNKARAAGLSASNSSNGTILTFVKAYDTGSKSWHCNLAVDALFGELLHKLPIRIVIGL